MLKNDPFVSPFERNYGVRRLVGNLYYSVRFRGWLRPLWKHPEADVFWYSVGPFILIQEPK